MIPITCGSSFIFPATTGAEVVLPVTTGREVNLPHVGTTGKNNPCQAPKSSRLIQAPIVSILIPLKIVNSRLKDFYFILGISQHQIATAADFRFHQ